MGWISNFLPAMQVNFAMYTKPGKTIGPLSGYHSVDPAVMRGQQLMDAGSVGFVKGAVLDVDKAMGFRNGIMYCVAPVASGNSPLAQYDFWLVGKDCCTQRAGS